VLSLQRNRRRPPKVNATGIAIDGAGQIHFGDGELLYPSSGSHTLTSKTQEGLALRTIIGIRFA